jgi:hypothetical protein
MKRRAPYPFRDVFRFLAGASLALVLAPLPVNTARAQQSVTEQEAHAIAVEAYLYFYPLVSVDITRRVATNVPPGVVPGFGPANTFNSFKEYPAGDFKAVVRPNFDTLYSSAFLDMTNEPVIVSAPDTNGRYYLLPMLDMWSDVFASPGWRTTGTQAGNFLITPPGWNGTVPSGMTRIKAPTPYVWIIGRTKTDGPQDYDAVHKIQDGYKSPRSRGGASPKSLSKRRLTRHENAAKGSGRHHARRQVLRLCSRASQG